MKTLKTMIVAAGLLLAQQSMAGQYWCVVNEAATEGSWDYSKQVALKQVDSKDLATEVYHDQQHDITYMVSFTKDEKNATAMSLSISNPSKKEIYALAYANANTVSVIGGTPLRAFTCAKLAE